METNAVKQTKEKVGQNSAISEFIEIARAKKLENTTKLILTAIYILIFASFVLWLAKQNDGYKPFHPSFFDLALLGFATMRLGRLVAFSQIMEPLRAPFAETVHDESGAGESVVAKGHGVCQAIGQLITCPICAGTWIAAGLVYGLYAFPEPTRLFLFITAGIGTAELLHSFIEALSWFGSHTRAQTGEILRRGMREETSVVKEYLPK